MEEEFVEGYGTLKLSEPTTLCDIANTLGYVHKVTPVVEKVEHLLEEHDYYRGVFDEQGRYKAGCLRMKSSYSEIYTEEKNPPLERTYTGEMKPVHGRGQSDEWTARNVLGYQLWDAAVEYQRIHPKLAESLKKLHDEFKAETEEMSKKGELGNG